MDISPLGVIRNTIFHVPSIVKTTALAAIGLSANAKDQDFLAEVVAASSRPVLGTPASLLSSQTQFAKDYGILGKIWISKVTIPRVEDACDIKTAVKQAIEFLGNGSEDYVMPDINAVYAEWTGHRRGATILSRKPRVDEREQYNRMMEEVGENAPTMLYFHGGAHCLGDPATHRFVTRPLARDTQGRCLSVRQQLSPQAMFPASLIDALLAYLYLIAPPPQAFHTAVSPSKIIITGDSSGAGIACSLTLLLLTLQRLPKPITNLGGIELPSSPAAGLAMQSPWLDISRSMPSIHRNVRYDIIAPPTPEAMVPKFPKDAIWPASPPRVETFCTAAMIDNPLVSPLAATTQMWSGIEEMKVYVCVGWEGMQDEAEVVARRMHEAGGDVRFEGYVGMPHCFALLLPNASGKRAWEGYAEFCRQAVGLKVELVVEKRAGMEVEGRRGWGVWIDKKGNRRRVQLERLGLDADGLGPGGRVPLDDETVSKMMAEQKDWRVKLEQEMMAEWNGEKH